MRYFFLFLLLPIASFAQQTINETMIHDGLTRSYTIYVPASYSPGTQAPMVLNFHGYTSNAFQQMFYGDFRAIADTAGFLLVIPDGTLDATGTTYWNSGWGGTVDDIGFTSALIDQIAASYSVNLNRVYSTGMSNRGFMSYTLACSLSNRIAAIASVTGSMNVGQDLTCNAQHPTPVMEIHGTADATVPYEGGGFMEAIPNVLNYWVNFNNCNATPVITDVPNTILSDGCTAMHYFYAGGSSGVDVEHYKVIDGGHTWPGSMFNIGVTNNDFNASKKIWQFFLQYDINGRIQANSVDDVSADEISVYPNPTADQIAIQGFSHKLSNSNCSLFSIEGKSFHVDFLDDNTLDTSSLESGVYFVRIATREGVATVQFVKV
ncbi:MAG: T9SS type A sorting domain-containing protein [Bacteroidetes bacterium]|nr:T9SS type A sorting domain-containing protein [Bacteroidota bacterium]